jgi:nucleoside-diphosphate-sugar epimerase
MSDNTLRGKKVLVSGGSGFIGSHLVYRLLAEGCQVAVLVRYGNIVKCERLRHCWDQITVIEADLRNRGALERIREFGPSIVYHLAAYNHVGESFQEVEECFDVNGKGTANLLDISKDIAEKFVYLSTSEVYGYQDRVPFVETMTPEPISPYAITKYAGELYCRMHQRMDIPMSVLIVRGFNVFGPYQSSKAIIPELIVKCLNNVPVRTTLGEQTREFNFVGNLVDGIVAISQHPERVTDVINIAAGEEVSIKDLVLKIAAATATKSDLEIGALPYRPTEIWRMVADNTRAKTILGWKPAISLDEGLQITVEWFREYVRTIHSVPSPMAFSGDVERVK